jgi:hypothetical protein
MVEKSATQESGVVHRTCRLAACMSESSALQLAMSSLLQPSCAPPPLPVGTAVGGLARYGVTTVVAVFKAGIYMPAHEGIAMLASSEAVELDAEAAAAEEKLLQLKVEAAAAA